MVCYSASRRSSSRRRSSISGGHNEATNSHSSLSVLEVLGIILGIIVGVILAIWVCCKCIPPDAETKEKEKEGLTEGEDGQEKTEDEDQEDQEELEMADRSRMIVTEKTEN